MYPSPHVRVSDADREAVVARLNHATAEGRLTIDEFGERTRAAYEARTWGELSRVVHDLPRVAAPMVIPRREAAGGPLPTVSLILGITSLAASFCVPLGAPAAIAAIVTGILGLRGAGRGMPGRTMAVTGLVLGVLGLVAQVAFLLFVAASDSYAD
ncbi:DUF1707 domain-containing protein [Actinoplanes sp. DH11]|uniref:DUF1707 SHOCT-like domain-containing protein n=1 Tax=Actinoplanes sp. DH11 TaxID=2857011 RepID=UPI001E5F129C|nr:DUF1707 domain-containing protein [Actinoplanes sp. DH11]